MNKETILAICFYFPYHEDSGVPVLFYRLANEIAKNYTKIIIYIIDYEDGVMARHLLNLPNIRLIPFKDGVKVAVPPEVILIMQSILPFRWPDELQPNTNTRLFFWNLHPRNLVPSLLPFLFLTSLSTNYWLVYRILSIFYPIFLPRLRKYVELLLDNKAICFMDDENYESTMKYLYLERDKEIDVLPIPVNQNIHLLERDRVLDIKQIKICWIGRLCDFKSYSLIYTINKLGQVAKKLDIRITYYIVGDGPYKKYIENNIIEKNNIDVIFSGSIPHEKLDDFLYRNVDVLTAQGTSALEGAKLHIPTIIIDGSYEKVRGDYQFRLLDGERKYDLGHLMTNSDFSPGNESLKEIILKLLREYKSEAKKAYQYYINNHTIESVSDKFLQKISQSKLTYGMIDKSYFKKSWSIWLHDTLHPFYEKIIGRTS